MSKNGTSLPADGERFLPECMFGEVELEHQHRYHAAYELVTGLDVLDIASGEGFGSALLAKNAKSVVGVDISEDAVNYSNAKYNTDNLRYLHGSCASIPLPDASVDAVISFETIEHHNQHEEMMAEVKRVLRPNGFLVISSPDKDEYNKLIGQPNPFHIKELFRDEFEALLNKWFKSHRLYGQRAHYGSRIATIDPAQESNSLTINFSKLYNNMNYVRGSPPPIYFIAVASDSIVPKLPLGVLYNYEQEFHKLWGELVVLKNKHIALSNEHITLSNEHMILSKKYMMLNQEINRFNCMFSVRIALFITLLLKGNLKEAFIKLKSPLTHSVNSPD